MAPSARIALAQVDTTVGDFAGNAARIRAATARARAAGAGLVVFPELAISGYPPRDFLDLPDFLERAARTLEELARPAEWSRGIAVVLGFVACIVLVAAMFNDYFGRRPHNLFAPYNSAQLK